MSDTDYLRLVERLMEAYDTTLSNLDDKDREDRTVQNPRLAELAEKIANILDAGADQMRTRAARWRGEH